MPTDSLQTIDPDQLARVSGGTTSNDQITAALMNPSHFNFGIPAAALVLLGALTIFVKRWFTRVAAASSKNSRPAVA